MTPQDQTGGSVRLLKTNRIEAEVLHSLLQSEGIDVELRGPVVSSLHPFSIGPMARVELWVARVDLERARELLEAAADAEFLDEDS